MEGVIGLMRDGDGTKSGALRGRRLLRTHTAAHMAFALFDHHEGNEMVMTSCHRCCGNPRGGHLEGGVLLHGPDLSKPLALALRQVV